MARTRVDPSVKEAIDVGLTKLQEDPPRFRALLKNASALVGEIADVLDEAGKAEFADKIRPISKNLKRATLLPVSMAGALIRKALGGVIG
jgi:hypothetical protein